MATSYQNFIDLADRLIRKRGRSVKIRRDTGAIPIDVAKPWLGNAPSIQDTLTFGLFATDEMIEQLVRLGSGRETPVRSTVQREGSSMLIPAKGLSFELLLAHKIVDGSRAHEITSLEKIAPGDATVLYIVALGR